MYKMLKAMKIIINLNCDINTSNNVYIYNDGVHKSDSNLNVRT